MGKVPLGPVAAGVAFTGLWVAAFDRTPVDSLKLALEGAAVVVAVVG